MILLCLFSIWLVVCIIIITICTLARDSDKDILDFVSNLDRKDIDE